MARSWGGGEFSLTVFLLGEKISRHWRASAPALWLAWGGDRALRRRRRQPRPPPPHASSRLRPAATDRIEAKQEVEGRAACHPSSCRKILPSTPGPSLPVSVLMAVHQPAPDRASGRLNTPGRAGSGRVQRLQSRIHLDEAEGRTPLTWSRYHGQRAHSSLQARGRVVGRAGGPASQRPAIRLSGPAYGGMGRLSPPSRT
jgi:hypothetical protein